MSMEEMLMMKNKQTCMYNNSSAAASSPALAMHKDSQTISKVKPKIRIIHIFAPEIIKTDVANFRELVQRLTGKPTTTTSAHDKTCCQKKLSRKNSSTTISTTRPRDHQEPKMVKKMEHQHQLRTGFRGFDTRDKIKEEEEIWRGTDINSGGGFLSGFADLDGFMQELGGEFPLLPCEASHHMHVFGETTLLS